MCPQYLRRRLLPHNEWKMEDPNSQILTMVAWNSWSRTVKVRFECIINDEFK